MPKNPLKQYLSGQNTAASTKSIDNDNYSQTILIESHTISITHPNKLMGSSPQLFKKDLIAYYRAIAPIMLPYIKNHPIVMQRFMNGIDEEGFYQKEISEHFPAYVKRVMLKKEGGFVHYALINNQASLVYLANQGVIVFHTWLSRTPDVNHPDRIIFDLDPSHTDFSRVRTAALLLKQLLDELELTSYVMTTGSRGVHVLIPIKPQYSFNQVRTFARTIAQIIVAQNPSLLTLELRKEKRGRKIFIDYLRNSYGATAVAPYSVRARPGAPVATPLEWKEISCKTLTPDKWTIKTIMRRLKRNPDPWQSMHKIKQSLTKAQKKLAKIITNKEEV